MRILYVIVYFINIIMASRGWTIDRLALCQQSGEVGLLDAVDRMSLYLQDKINTLRSSLDNELKTIEAKIKENTVKYASLIQEMKLSFSACASCSSNCWLSNLFSSTNLLYAI